MILIINGEDREFSSIATVSALLEQLGMKPDRVAVELNRELVSRERWDKTRLSDGDKLEIVHFVGGGSPTPLSSDSQKFRQLPCRRRHTSSPIRSEHLFSSSLE
jgi:thiamine biosynthesis protein ThiS